MEQRNNEQLSALIDGELDRRESDFLIRRLARDSELQHDWQRYHMARACLQREFSGPCDLVRRVSDALENERIDPVARMSPLTRYGLGGAMAAGIAMLAVVGLNNRMAPDSAPGQTSEAPAFVSQSSALDRQFSQQAVPVGLNTSEQRPNSDVSRQRISRYIIRHGQAVGSSNFVSFTPILTAAETVSFESEEGPTEAVTRASADE